MTAALFVSTVLIWGTSWIAISLQVGPVPVAVSVFYRFAAAGALMLAGLALAGRLRLPEARHHPWLVAQALCLFSLNFLCFYAAAAHVSSGLLSVIFSLATVFNAFNGRLFFGEPITARSLLASALGVLGLGLIFAPDIAAERSSGYLAGLGLACLGTLFFSLGNMVSRRNAAAGLGTITANAWSMAYGGALLFVLIRAAGIPVVAPPDTVYVAALLYLAVVGSVVGFTTYLTLVARMGPARAAYTTVLFPVVALAVSTVFEGYAWSAGGALGVALALAGNVVMFARRPAPRPRVPPPPPPPPPAGG